LNDDTPHSWQAVQQAIRRRITQREWAPGELIPHEADLAQEFGCARSTMNRALRGLADDGLLERKRKAGTRVALNPVRQVRVEIPVIREEIESKGNAFHYLLLRKELHVPPPDICARLQSDPNQPHLHIETLYTANQRPYVYEDRWINLNAVPQASDEAFDTLSPNEWLVRQVPFESGDFTFSAISATARIAEVLSCEPGQGLFVLDRTTRSKDHVLTTVRLTFHAGYQLRTEI
jgi:GntR family histidine utilization transcriptional repressor